MLDRRELLLLGTAVLVMSDLPTLGHEPHQSEASDHPIFATRHLGGMKWKHCHLNMATNVEERWLLEVQAAVRQEIITQVERDWLDPLQARQPSMVYKPSHSVSFLGELQTTFIDMIASIETANTAIISPTALTVIQSSASERFQRTPSQAMATMKTVGMIDHRIKVVVDQFSCDHIPVLVGFVPEDQSQRNHALIELGPEDFLFGRRLNHVDNDWVPIGLDVHHLMFI